MTLKPKKRVIFFNTPKTQRSILKKRYRFNPLTNGDTPYAPQYYEHMLKSADDARTKYLDPLTWRVRAVQAVLHEQTNYDEICRREAFFSQPLEHFTNQLKSFYEAVKRRHPRYRDACDLELARHIHLYHQHNG